MDYEQTLLFFTVIQIIRVILYKSKYFLWIFSILSLVVIPEAVLAVGMAQGTSTIYTEERAPNLNC